MYTYACVFLCACSFLNVSQGFLFIYLFHTRATFCCVEDELLHLRFYSFLKFCSKFILPMKLYKKILIFKNFCIT
uniref:Uncharacterized protein n=1 Tax=Octopus bimaculoides TaxID=37653 RepID=A0A0L8HJ48_OCTBM